MINSLRDFYWSSWTYLILGSISLPKLRSMHSLLPMLFLFTFSEVWPSTPRSPLILIPILIRLCSLGFYWKISTSMLRYLNRSVLNSSRHRYSYTSNRPNKYTWCTKTSKQHYHLQTHQNYQNPHNLRNN